MSTLIDNIPAFNMWKSFHDTVTCIVKTGNWEAGIEKLSKIIHDYANILFIFNRPPNMTFEQYENILENYKAFTTWLHGQLFYMLGQDNFKKSHDTIVEMQIYILDKLSNTVLHIYHELANEYKKILQLSIRYLEESQETSVLAVFIPKKLDDLNEELNLNQTFLEIRSKNKCTTMLPKLLAIVKFILIENFTFCCFDENTNTALDGLIYLLSNSDETIKLKIIDIFVDISVTSHFNSHVTFNVEIKSRLSTLASLFEQFIYLVFDSDILSDDNKQTFEQCLIKYLNSAPRNSLKINEYIFDKSLNNSIQISEELKSVAANRLEKTLVSTEMVAKVMNFSNAPLLPSFKQCLYRNINGLEIINDGIKLFHEDICEVWHKVHFQIMLKLDQIDCTVSCCFTDFFKFFNYLSRILLKINLELSKSRKEPVKICYFDEKELLRLFIKKYLEHTNRCDKTGKTIEDALNFLVSSVILTNSSNLNIIFNMIACPLLQIYCFKNENQLSNNFVGEGQLGDVKIAIRAFFKYLSSQNITNGISFRLINNFFAIISDKLLVLNSKHLKEIENSYVAICKGAVESKEVKKLCLVIESIPYALTIFEDLEVIITQIFNVAFSLKTTDVVKTALKALTQIICCSNSEFKRILRCTEQDFLITSNLYCKSCVCDKKTNLLLKENAIGIDYKKIDIEQFTINLYVKDVLSYLSSTSEELKIAALDCLPYLSNHISQFHSKSTTQIWSELVGDESKNVRDKFSKIICDTLKNGQENQILSKELKSEVLEIILSAILKHTKKSLQYSNFDLQNTILDTINSTANIKGDYLIAETFKILFYLIMIPTSKYKLIAVNRCYKIAETNEISIHTIYCQNQKEFCETIVHLCCVNLHLIDYTLATSLEKISLMFGFYGSKYFVNAESHCLLPFFVSKIVTMPNVNTGRLIEEAAGMMEMEVADLLSSKYGYIFIHIFLDDLPKEKLRDCMVFLEKSTCTSGVKLRKKNFRIILNKLLLNFHEKNEKVLLALKLLCSEDPNNKGNSLQDYLHSHFLGVLLYFDTKLIPRSSRKDKVLLSLADLLRFMGPKHIMPLRFKIIAMLQTIKYDNFPHLTCAVWDAFIKSCEIECLGPQLAAISVSILPLIEHCSSEINAIFRYLVIQNESHMKDHISDLFFLNNPEINREIILVIDKYLKALESSTLKEKLRKFLRYLRHESMEVRIQSLAKLKTFLEQSREELDQMILDYNGMDPIIVELIDILAQGCREKDDALKLHCGDVLGELGAIEPSHMPRKYNQEDKFSFYIWDYSFVLSSLNELIKAFQAEKNTRSMDRYALAIQETLRRYEISPESTSKKHDLWVQFPESQKEVMLPLLSSRYKIAQTVFANDLPTPIYGSNYGASFESWLFHWTSSLISSLPNERKESLKGYLPSMKQDNRILMHFLPHILVLALLEGSDKITEKSFAEIQTVTSSFTKEVHLDDKVLKSKPVSAQSIVSDTKEVTPEEAKRLQCTKVVFLLLDFLDRWVREWQWQRGTAGSSEQHFHLIRSFQNEFCKLQLAKCNYRCGEYARALIYLEDYITENEGQLLEHLSFFAEIYSQLEEPDGVDGAMALQQNEPSIEQKILALEISGKHSDATSCYERTPQPLQFQHIQGLTRCYLALDNVNTALNFARDAHANHPEFGNALLEMQAESLWRLGQYEELNTLLDNPDLEESKSWGVQVGKALLHMRNGERDAFKATLEGLQKQQVFAFGAMSLEEGAYKSGYGYIAKLHALNELHQVEKVLSDLLLSPNNKEYAENMMKKLLDEWSLRIKVVQESVGVVEPLLCLRRVALNLARSIAEQRVPSAVPHLNALIGECWLFSAKTHRSAGMLQQAYTFSLKAEQYAPPTLFLEKAKLHWLREEREQAFHILKRGLEVFLPEGGSPEMLTHEQRKICAEAKLLIASYNDQISNVEIDVIKQNYKESVEMFKDWEKSLVYMAQYLDKIFQNLSDSKDADREHKCSELQLQIINYFGKSLQYGTNYIYQSMPRLLSIWFDYGTRVLEVTESSKKEDRKNTLLKMTKLIDSFLKRLPAFMFLTTFSQLVSRICHPQKEVYIMLKAIILKILQHYPQQSLWMIISVIKSSYPVGAKRCAEILCDPSLKIASLTKLVRDFTSLAEKLIELCNKDIPPDVSTASVSVLLKALPKLLMKHDFSQIMMPTFKLRKLILPNPDFTNTQHNPFPNSYVYITGIEDEISVLSSLQRPRKIILKGSDGKRYIFMLKAKDDLRKDFRLMEFNDIVNQLLTREGEARQRRLNIRLYSVAPLNEECGIIEWVPNLVGLRNILIPIYKQKGCLMRARDLKPLTCSLKDSLEKKREVFLKKLLPRHPPVLGEWFRKTFPDAQTWLTARTDYVRTTAVMSIAGYILGLGDRHGENINLDSTCGDVVHVDFNCLFNKGEKFEWPERVPFRLTHNMVSAMGPLGVEGLFRKSCIFTLRVLRNNTNTLMSIVAPFVYDPLVSWPRHQSSLGSAHNAERTNEEAVDHIKNIEYRLQGIVKTRNRTLTTPLSVEGQANYLIKEAISIDNLCQMYIGWGAYM